MKFIMFPYRQECVSSTGDSNGHHSGENKTHTSCKESIVIAFNDFDAKKSACCSLMLVVTKQGPVLLQKIE